MNHKATRRRRALLIPAVAIAGASAALATVLSTALFTDSATIPANTLTAGTIKISSTPTTALLSLSGMMPGDTITAPLTIKNDGNQAMRYALSTTTTDTDNKHLAAAVNVTVKTGVTTCTTAGFGTTGTAVGTVQPLSTFAIGDPTQGAQTGDRPLAAGASDILCVQATLPLTAANALQAATTTATFTLDAEQTKNN